MTLRFDLHLLDDTETDLHRLLVRCLWGVVSMTETMYTRELVHRLKEYKYLGLYICKVEQIYTCTYTHASW